MDNFNKQQKLTVTIPRIITLRSGSLKIRKRPSLTSLPFMNFLWLLFSGNEKRFYGKMKQVFIFNEEFYNLAQ